MGRIYTAWPYGFYDESGAPDRRVERWDAHTDILIPTVPTQPIPVLEADPKRDRIITALRLSIANDVVTLTSFAFYAHNPMNGFREDETLSRVLLHPKLDIPAGPAGETRFFNIGELAQGAPAVWPLLAGHRLYAFYSSITGGDFVMRAEFYGLRAVPGYLWPVAPQ